ncbi:hypothetical protein BC830DRAFT_821678 [Chytriomyces sp. MP71]|nr:hypothetical protein BC830DRAFT_821678 [Chytriomyces sp. MP71]
MSSFTSILLATNIAAYKQQGKKKSFEQTHVPSIAIPALEVGVNANFQVMTLESPNLNTDALFMGSTTSNETIEQQRYIPDTLNDGLASITSRRLLYLSLRTVVLSCNSSLETMVQGVKEIIPSACKWFLSVWPEHGLNDTIDAYFRIKIFQAFKTMYAIVSAANPAPANRDALVALLKRVIFLEPQGDLHDALFADVDACICDEEMLDWAWHLHVSSSGEAEKSASYDSMSRRLERTKFCYPCSIDDERLTVTIKEIFTRLDLIASFLSRMEQYASLYQCALQEHQIPAEEPSVQPLSLPFTRNHVGVDPQTLYKKVEWMTQFLARHGHLFSVPMARVAENLCIEFSSLIDPRKENDTWQCVSSDFQKKMRFGKVLLNSQHTRITSTPVIEKNKMTEHTIPSLPLTINQDVPPSQLTLVAFSSV